MTTLGQPAPVSPDLECTICASGVTSPHGVPATPGRAPCGCPETDGKTYHQRGTCTDPVVARLDWYADGPAQPPATPGRVPYEGLSPYGIAVTALERILDLDTGWMSWDEARAIASEAATLAVARSAAKEPEPELAAAMRETRDVRDGYARLCGEFSDSPQSGQSARVSLTVLNRHRAAAGLPALRPAPAGERRDPYMKLAEERDQLRELLDEVGVMAANAPEEGDSFGLLEEIAMRIGAAEVPPS